MSRHGVDLGSALIKACLADARYPTEPHRLRDQNQQRWHLHRMPGLRPNGTNTDDQGRRYTKIDCTTKKPLWP